MADQRESIDVAELHRRVPVTDAHADSLMWNRDLTQRCDGGHVDFPRLKEAGVKIQCFTIVTRGLPFIDGFSIFARAQRWPKAPRASEWPRCTWQVDRLAHFCRESKGQVSIAGSAAQLTRNLEAGTLSAVVGIEGGHALEGDPSRVAQLMERGVRFMSLSHLANNELGGTSSPFHGNRPLTPLGRQVLEAMAGSKMTLDIAHASPAMLPELLGYSGKLFCSHAGVQGANAMWRNLSDEVLKKLADRGGVVGIIFAPRFLGGDTMDFVVKHVRHAIDVMGEDGVGFGSDFDGMVPLPKGMRDVTGLPRLTQALVDAGLPVRVIEKVIGANFRRFFGESLG